MFWGPCLGLESFCRFFHGQDLVSQTNALWVHISVPLLLTLGSSASALCVIEIDKRPDQELRQGLLGLMLKGHSTVSSWLTVGSCWGHYIGHSEGGLHVS